MDEFRKAKDVIHKLEYILSAKQKRYAVLVLLMSLAATLLETLGVAGIYLVKTLYFIFYSWVSAKYSYMVQRELSVRVLSAYMRQGYMFLYRIIRHV